MRSSNVSSQVALAFVVICALPAHAQLSACTSALASAGVTRLSPWPNPSAEMIERLKLMADDTRVDESLRRELRRVLEPQSPQATVRLIFAPATNDEIRRTYVPGTEAWRKPAALRQDPRGLRAALARSVRGIEDHDLRREWTRYLTLDPVEEVRVAAVAAQLAWTEPETRDAFVTAPELDEPERRLRMLVAREDLDRLSPAVRWRAVKYLVPYFPRPDPKLTAAIESFAAVDLLKRWYRDQLRAHTVHRTLRDWDATRRTNELEDGDGLRRHRALELGQLLHGLDNAAYRRFALDEIDRIARGPTSVARLANETLAWNSIWDTIEQHALAHARGEDRETLTTAALRRDALDPEILALAIRMKNDFESKLFEPRRAYTDADIAAFEASL